MIGLFPLAHLLPDGDVSASGVFLHAAGWGIQHIIPFGLDHMAFLLGLFFLARRMPDLVAQVAVFTVAHSFSLPLMMLGLISVSSGWVEIVVALSIAYVAVENLWGEGLRHWRMALLTVFGLIHGLAYGHSFLDRAAEPSVLPSAVIGFNVGLGLGQLIVLSLAFALFAPIWQRTWYRKWVAIPASCAIAVSGLAWAVERSLAL